jgi:hypothetical protein
MLILIPLLAYAAVAFYFTVQTRLIFPGSGTQGRPEAVVRPPRTRSWWP